MKTRNRLILNSIKVLLVFCTLFSQLSFSLEVFAEEVIGSSLLEEAVDNLEDDSNSNALENDNVDSENVIKNQEDTLELENINDDTLNSLEDSKNTNNQETNDDEENFDPDDENNTDEDKEDEENNSDEDTDEEEIVDVDEIVVLEDSIVALGSLDGELTVSSLKELLGEEYSDAVVTLDGIELEDDKVVVSGMILTNNGIEYVISILYDLNSDGIVNYHDVDMLMEEVLKDESKFDITDVTFVYDAVRNGVWNFDVTVSDVLNGSLSNNDALVGDEVEVKFYLKGFDKDMIDGIYGMIDYDKNLLELEDIKVLDSAFNISNENEEGKFVYLLNDYKNMSNEVLITFTFKALAVGDTEVSIKNLDIAYRGKRVLLKNDSLVTYVSIAPIGMGGDDDNKNDNNNGMGENGTNNSQESGSNQRVEETIKVVNTVNTVPSNSKNVTLSRNNYISALEIKGYDIDFDMYTYEYSISVDNDVDSLEISVVLDSAFSSYVIRGNENLKEGANKVEIVVTAEDGTERTYSINVDKEEKKTVKSSDDDEEEEVEEASSASKTVIIILIILVIIGLIYVIFKDDEEEEVSSSSTKKSDTSHKNDSNKKKNNSNKKK